jgi:hypothetical protein
MTREDIYSTGDKLLAEIVSVLKAINSNKEMK